MVLSDEDIRRIAAAVADELERRKGPHGGASSISYTKAGAPGDGRGGSGPGRPIT